MKRLLSAVFLCAVWLYGSQAFAAMSASHDKAIKNAVEIHQGVNLVHDKDLTYQVTLKGTKATVKLMSGPKGMMAKPIKLEMTRKKGDRGHGYCAGYYYYYCWYDYYGNYWCDWYWACY